MISTPTILKCLWAAMGLYWLASAVRTKKTAVNEAAASRIPRLILLGLMFTMLLTDVFRIGWLARRYLPEYPWTPPVGVAVTVAGLALAVWARRHLGEYWSDKVALKVDHQLIRSGPYAVLRHPIYSGVLLAIAGSVLAIGEWRGVLVFAVMSLNYWLKASREDRILSRQFGDGYEEHKRQAGFLLPKL